MVSMRFQSCFEKLKSTKKMAFIPFFVLGYPDCSFCIADIKRAIMSGADALEFGIPFSDPIADGIVIQEAAKSALDEGVTVSDCLKIIQSVRAEYPIIPIGLLVYANLVEHMGLENFYAAFEQAGVDAVLIADVPLDESLPYQQAAQKEGLHHIFMTTPSCSENTLQQISARASGYIYVISRQGVTGVDKEIQFNRLKEQIEILERMTVLPKLIGFGVSKKDHILKVKNAGGDGVIVGSYLIEKRKNISMLVKDFKLMC